MQDATGIILRDYSLSSMDLIPEDDEDDIEEVDERQQQYARYAKLVDKDDAKAMILARFAESLDVDAAIEEALDDPLDADRPRLHVNDMLRLAQAFITITKDVLDEYIGMLAVAGGED